MAQPLPSDEIHEALQDLNGWTFELDSLKKTFEFSHFKEAMAFILRVAFEAEAMNHHPDLRNVYNRVEIALYTHDAGNKVTERDLKLARQIEAFNWR